jgi:hypothetical protein
MPPLGNTAIRTNKPVKTMIKNPTTDIGFILKKIF